MTSVGFTILISIVASIVGWYIPVLRRSYGSSLRRYFLASAFSTALVALITSLL